VGRGIGEQGLTRSGEGKGGGEERRGREEGDLASLKWLRPQRS